MDNVKIFKDRDLLINMINENNFNQLDCVRGDLKISVERTYIFAYTVGYHLLDLRCLKIFIEFCKENNLDIFINNVLFANSSKLFSFEREGSSISIYDNYEVCIASIKYEDIINIYARQIIRL